MGGGLRAMKGAAMGAWHILPVSNTPFFQGDFRKSQTGRPMEQATGWWEALTQVP